MRFKRCMFEQRKYFCNQERSCAFTGQSKQQHINSHIHTIMNKLNDTQLGNIIGGTDAAAFLKGFINEDGALLISGVRQSTFSDGTIMTSKRHRMLQDPSPDSVNAALAGFKAQNMTRVVIGIGANSKEYGLDELAKILA